VSTLLGHPQQLGEMRADWRLADPAGKELLRYISFAQVSKPRYARADTEFHGQLIRRGQMLFACLAAANSDPTVWGDTDERVARQSP
jgi:cytochrome P450